MYEYTGKIEDELVTYRKCGFQPKNWLR